MATDGGADDRQRRELITPGRDGTDLLANLDGEGGTFVVGTVALILLVSSLWYLDQYGIIADEGSLTLAPEVLEAVNVVVIGVAVAALLYGTYWLAGRDLSETEKWRAGIWCAAGYVGSVAVVAFLQAHWLLDGYAPPTEAMVEHYLVAVGTGSIAGLLVGVNTARVRRSRATVTRQRDAFAVINEFLRHHVLNGVQVIMGYTDLLREDADETVESHLAAVDDRSESIVSLVQQLSAVMGSIAGETDLHPVDLAAVVEQEVISVRETFPDVTFRVDVPAGVSVEADRLLGDVVSNLLRNAAEHGPGSPAGEGSPSNTHDLTVRVAAAIQDDSVTLTVSDDGTGIPDERKDGIFEPGEPGPRRVGRGLGLFLVDVLVERYGGQVHVEDNEPRGATFAVELRRA